MSRWIQVHADVVLRLMHCQDRPSRDRMLARGCQVVDGDIEVHLHLLVTRPSGPHRRAIRRLGLE